MARRCCRAAAARGGSASRFDSRQQPVDTSAAARAESLPREKRLAKRREFLRVYEEGRRIFSRHTVLFYAPSGLPYSRIGITATRKLGKANVRNRLKRWTREVYRRQRGPLGLDVRRFDFVVNVKPSAAEATFEEYAGDLVRAFRRAIRTEA